MPVEEAMRLLVGVSEDAYSGVSISKQAIPVDSRAISAVRIGRPKARSAA
jgi:hypothetical protein